jgi:hypothetical protein
MITLEFLTLQPLDELKTTSGLKSIILKSTNLKFD